MKLTKFDPLATCPPDRRQKYLKRAKLANENYRPAVELKCLECCAWDRTEVKRCAITSCPLWALSSRRIFGAHQAADESPTPTAIEEVMACA